MSGIPGTLLHKVIMPRVGDPRNVRSLYLEEHPRNPHPAHTADRSTVHLPGLSEVSFGTYFNAFPASYWRRWTAVDRVRLRLVVGGPCRVAVHRSKADGTHVHVRDLAADGPGRTVLSTTLDLDPFEDGGWYWFDLLTPGPDAAVLHAGGWYADGDVTGPVTATVGMPTFDRPADCVAALRELATDDDLLTMLDGVVVVDQGTDRVAGHPDLGAARRALGGRLRVVEQPNLGGSGGFARVVHEALRASAEQIVFMDDDVLVEPESVRRSLVFAACARQPVLVGAQMLDLHTRTTLRTMGEVIDRGRFVWVAAPGTEYDHDLAAAPLRGTPWLHRRVDVDYNGWWTCVVPRSVAREVGLPLPLFLKWDDAEYCLRAARAGVPTVTVPGVAVWHEPWSDKDHAVDWQAYFHQRNRLVVTALFGPARLPVGLLRHSLRVSVRHLLSLEYSTVAVRNLAADDFLAGPSELFPGLATVRERVRSARTGYPDAHVARSATDLPEVKDAGVRPVLGRARPARSFRALVGAFAHNARRPADRTAPQGSVSAGHAKWWVLGRLDGVAVVTADGRGVAYRRRHRRTFWTLLAGVLRGHLRLALRYPAARRAWRRAHAELSGARAWGEYFATTETSGDR